MTYDAVPTLERRTIVSPRARIPWIRRWGGQAGATPRAASRPWVMLAELAFITAAVPVFGYALQRGDPFAVHAAFFWPLLAPLVVSLRHGVGPGTASAVALNALYAADEHRHGRAAYYLPPAALIGMLALVLVCGEFAQASRRSLRRLEASLAAATAAATALSREQTLLELSHDRLEASHGNRTDLRSALAAIRRLAGAASTDVARVADGIMNVLCSHFLIEVASLYGVHENRLSSAPMSVIGRPESLPEEGDQLVAVAVASGELALAPRWEVRGATKTMLVLAAPLLDSTGVVRGVLCVRSMSLFALETSALRNLAVMCGHAGDLLAQMAGAADWAKPPGDELDAHIVRAARDLKSGVPTAVIAVPLPLHGAARHAVEALLYQSLRESDRVVVQPDQEPPIVAVVLPQTDERGARALEARLRKRAESEPGAARIPLSFAFVHAVTAADNGKSILNRIRTRTSSHDSGMAIVGIG